MAQAHATYVSCPNPKGECSLTSINGQCQTGRKINLEKQYGRYILGLGNPEILPDCLKRRCFI